MHSKPSAFKSGSNLQGGPWVSLRGCLARIVTWSWTVSCRAVCSRCIWWCWGGWVSLGCWFIGCWMPRILTIWWLPLITAGVSSCRSSGSNLEYGILGTPCRMSRCPMTRHGLLCSCRNASNLSTFSFSLLLKI